MTSGFTHDTDSFESFILFYKLYDEQHYRSEQNYSVNAIKCEQNSARRIKSQLVLKRDSFV